MWQGINTEVDERTHTGSLQQLGEYGLQLRLLRIQKSVAAHSYKPGLFYFFLLCAENGLPLAYRFQTARISAVRAMHKQRGGI